MSWVGVAVTYASANLPGRWTSSIPREMVRPLHQSIDTLRHYQSRFGPQCCMA